MALARIVNFPETDLREMKDIITDKEKTTFEELFHFKFDDIERLTSEYMGVAIEYTPNEVEVYLDNKLKSKGVNLSKPEVSFDSEHIDLTRKGIKKIEKDYRGYEINKVLFEIEYYEWFFDYDAEDENWLDKYTHNALIKASDIENLISNMRKTTSYPAHHQIHINLEDWSLDCSFGIIKPGKKIIANLDVSAPSFWTSKYLSDNLKVEIPDQSDRSGSTLVTKEYSDYKKIVDDLLGLII